MEGVEIIDLGDHLREVTAAVRAYAVVKLEKLIRKMEYEPSEAKTVREVVSAQAGSTFLWVALVCNELANTTRSWNVKETNFAVPAGLTDLYDRMMSDLDRETEPSKVILRSVLVAAEPLRCIDIQGIVPNKPNQTTVLNMIRSCGSFLTLENDRVRLIHESARDYLTSAKGQTRLAFHAIAAHEFLARQAIEQMHHTLIQNNLCGVEVPDVETSEVPESIITSQIGHLRYWVKYWLWHYAEFSAEVQRSKNSDLPNLLIRLSREIHEFLTTYLLRWLESMFWLWHDFKEVQGMMQIKAVAKVCHFLCSFTKRKLIAQTRIGTTNYMIFWQT